MVWIRVGQRGWGNGYGGYRPRYGGGGGGCLRDLLLLDAGCCLAETLGCGTQLVLLSPALAGLALHRAPRQESRAVAAVRLYQERISSRRAHPCCRMSPSCSNYALEALEGHGTARGIRLTVTRLLRCRPGGRAGADPVPAPRRQAQSPHSSPRSKAASRSRVE